MGKKNIPMNRHAAAAAERNDEAKIASSKKDQADAENGYWAEAGKGEKSGKKDKKKEEGALGKVEKDKKKAEAKNLASLEEAEMADYGKKKDKKKDKVTLFELDKKKRPTESTGQEGSHRQGEGAIKGRHGQRIRECGCG